jgi:hypothetical protein
MSGFLSNFNIRVILLHLVTFWLFFYAGQTFCFLHDRNFFNPTYGSVFRSQYADVYKHDLVLIRQMGNVSLLLAYVLAWFVSSKHGWHWINDAITFVIAFALANLDWFGGDHLAPVFLVPGKIFIPNSWESYVLDGLVMMALGLLVLYSKRLIGFINRGQKDKQQALAAEKTARRVR